MIVGAALFAMVILQALGALTMTALTARIRLADARRGAVEAELALGSAIATARVNNAATLVTVIPGPVLELPVTAPAGWQARAWAERGTPHGPVRLVVEVTRRDAAGALRARRRGGLILAPDPADTAVTITTRSRF